MPEKDRNIPTGGLDPLKESSSEELLSPDILVQIKAAGKEKEYLRDKKIAEDNPSEKGSFTDKYLKGFGQVLKLKDGTELTWNGLLEIGKVDPKKEAEILGQLPEETEDAYREWKQKGLKQEVNQKTGVDAGIKEKELQVDTSIASGREKLIKLEQITKEGVEKAQSVLGNKFPKAEAIQRESLAKEIPQLQGISPEELSTGKYDSIVTAYYLVRNEEKIASGLSQGDRIQFLEITNSLDRSLGGVSKEVKKYYDKIDSLVLGTGVEKEAIKARGAKWIRDGYSDVSFNTQSREFEFRNRTGLSKSINISGQIARESVQLAGLSVSREVPPVNPDIRDLEGRYEALDRVAKNGVLKDPEKNPYIVAGSEEKNTIDTLFIQADISQDQGKLLDALNYTGHAYAQEQQLLDKQREKARSNGEIAELAVIEDKNRIIASKLGEIKMRMSEYESLLRDEETTYNIHTDDRFDTIAQENLSWLTSDSELFHRMGPEANTVLYRIIDEVNRDRSVPNQIHLDKKVLSQSDKDTLSEKYSTIIKNLGYDRGVLRSDMIGDFQKKIAQALAGRGGDTIGSIENLMKTKKSE